MTTHPSAADLHSQDQPVVDVPAKGPIAEPEASSYTITWRISNYTEYALEVDPINGPYASNGSWQDFPPSATMIAAGTPANPQTAQIAFLQGSTFPGIGSAGMVAWKISAYDNWVVMVANNPYVRSAAKRAVTVGTAAVAIPCNKENFNNYLKFGSESMNAYIMDANDQQIATVQIRASMLLEGNGLTAQYDFTTVTNRPPH